MKLRRARLFRTTCDKEVPFNYLCRRHTSDGGVTSSSFHSSSINPELARKSKFHCQLQEIPIRPKKITYGPLPIL